MLDLFLAAFFFGLMVLGLRRPFIWVLAYLYVDILSPQKISYFLLASLPVSLMVFIAAFAGWLLVDDKRDCRFNYRQALIAVLLVYCGVTTLDADFPVEAAAKWSWVWKALVFAMFLPLTLRTRLRFEAAALTMVLAAGAIIIDGGIKAVGGGGGYGELKFFVNDNTGLYEGSTLSMVAIAMIPLIWWLAGYGTIYRKGWLVKLFALALTFACIMIPIGTQTRTGLLCLLLLGVLSLRNIRHKFLYLTLAGLAAAAAVPFLPESYTKRMSTIENHQSDESASTRVAVWAWTWEYAKDHPFGGGFESYRSNRLTVKTRAASTDGNTTAVAVTEVQDQSRAFHSSYFEMLGEQGWPGLLLWLWLQLSGVWQMERLRWRWRKRATEAGAGPDLQWQAPLASALQSAQLVYLTGSFFVGIAFQPFIYMLIGLQCALWTYLRRVDRPAQTPIGARLAAKPVLAA